MEIIHHNQGGFIPGMQSWFSIDKWVSAIQHMNRCKDRNYVIILTNVEKALNKVHYPFKSWRKEEHITTIKGYI